MLAHLDSILTDVLRQLIEHAFLENRIRLGQVRLDAVHDAHAVEIASLCPRKVLEGVVDLRLEVLENAVRALDLRLHLPLHEQAPSCDLLGQKPTVPGERDGIRQCSLEPAKFLPAARHGGHAAVEQVVDALTDLVDLAVRGGSDVLGNSGLPNGPSSGGQRTLDRATEGG